MRVALVHYTTPPVTGGVEAILGRHAALLAAAGHDVRVITGRGEGVRLPEVDSRHPEVQAIADQLEGGEVDGDAFEALTKRLTERLRSLLADRDVVVAHNVLTMPFNLPLAAALGRLGLPVVAWTHDIAWINPRYSDYRRDGWPYDLLRTPQPRSLYVAVSEVRRDELAQLFAVAEADVPVVPNGIDVDSFLGIRAWTRELVERAGAGAADPLVLVPLRVTPRKRLELAIEAASELWRRHPQLRVCVTGPLGPHSAGNREYWRKLSSLRARLGLDEVVLFLHEQVPEGAPHPVSEQMIAELYRLADVVLMPSESEGFGLPVIEAALSRAPLVCADIPVLREAGGGALHLFPPGSGGSGVAAAVERALQDPLVADRRRVVRHNSWSMLAPKIEAVLQRACEVAGA